jgi:hypothetical protein
MVTVCRFAKTPPLTGFEAIVAHQPRDPVTPRSNPAFTQFSMHAR